MKDFILGWLLGKTLSNGEDDGDGLIGVMGNGILLLFGLAALGIWFKFCKWITSFAGPLGPFVEVFGPFLLIGICINKVKSKSDFLNVLFVCAVLSALFILYMLWQNDHI